MNPSSSDAAAALPQTRASRRQQRPLPHDIAGHTDHSPASPRQANPGTHPGYTTSGRPKESARHLDSENRRATENPPLLVPVPGLAKVKLNLQARTDAELATFGESHIAAMTDNPWFEDPMPSTVSFDRDLADFENSLIELDNLRLLVKNLTAQKNRKRQVLESQLTVRGNYVQATSNGNADVIASAGLSARRPRTRPGALLAPLGLRLEVTQFSGELLVRWLTVTSARIYVLECAQIIDGEPLAWAQIHIGGKLMFLAQQLTPGQHYAFRVTALGGATGSSPCSPVVERMVA